MDRTSLHFDAPLLGQPIAEKDETGAWTDYIFDGGKCIARGGQFAATPVAAQQVTVRFTNDTCSACLGQPPFQDRNLQVDSITIGGTTIPSSDPSVSFAGGYYVSPGLMATNGDLTFTLASSLTGPVSVQAWGTPDTGVYPHMQVLVNGALVSEYDVTASPQAYTAALTPTDPSVTTTFYLADHLGSAQMEFSSNGTPLSSSQFFPFGGEINPVPTTNHYKFTGKERDNESGLDYFGARYYGSNMGRFMSPDIGVDQHPEDPQSWNLYAYARNNPLIFIDPSGNYVCGSTLSAAQCTAFQNGLDQAQTSANALKEKYGADSSQYKNAQGAIDSYGKQGVDNGVTIQVGNTGKYAGEVTVAGSTGQKTADNPTGQKITATFNPNFLTGDSNAGLLEGHEGSHVADGSAWVASGFSPALNPTRYQTELNAYRVQANLADGFGYTYSTVNFGGRSYVLNINGWNPSNTDLTIQHILHEEYKISPGSAVKAFQKNTIGGH